MYTLNGRSIWYPEKFRPHLFPVLPISASAVGRKWTLDRRCSHLQDDAAFPISLAIISNHYTIRNVEDEDQ